MGPLAAWLVLCWLFFVSGSVGSQREVSAETFDYLYHPGDTRTLNSVTFVDFDDFSLELNTTIPSTDVAIFLTIGRIQSTASANFIVFRILLDGVEVASTTLGQVYSWKLKPLYMLTHVLGVSVGTHVVKLQYKVSNSAFYAYTDANGAANRFVGVLKHNPGDIQAITVTVPDDSLAQVGSWQPLPTAVAVDVTTTAESTRLLILVDVSKVQHTVSGTAGNVAVRATVDGGQACMAHTGQCVGGEFAGVTFSCVVTVAAGDHTVQLDYQVQAAGAVISLRRELVVVQLDQNYINSEYTSKAVPHLTQLDSSTYVDLPHSIELTTTITAPEDGVLFALASIAYLEQTGPWNQNTFHRIAVDGVEEADTNTGSSVLPLLASPFLMTMVDVLAGEHTVKVQTKRSAGGQGMTYANTAVGEGHVNMFVVFLPHTEAASVQGDPWFQTFGGHRVQLHLHPGVFCLAATPAFVVNALIEQQPWLPPEEDHVMTMVSVVQRGVKGRPGSVDCGSERCVIRGTLTHTLFPSGVKVSVDAFSISIFGLRVAQIVRRDSNTLQLFQPAHQAGVFISRRGNNGAQLHGLLGDIDRLGVDTVQQFVAEYEVHDGSLLHSWSSSS